jgi:hypothetical protein
MLVSIDVINLFVLRNLVIVAGEDARSDNHGRMRPFS